MSQAGRSRLLDLILVSAKDHRHRPALIAEGETRSYDWLIGRAARIAARLVTLGAPGDRCAVLGRRSAMSYVGFLAALGAGQVYVPLSPRDPVSRQAAMLDRAEVGYLIVDPGFLAGLKDILALTPNPPVVLAPESSRAEILAASLPTTATVLGAEDFQDCDDLDRVAPPCAEEDPAYLLFTSGSTGVPKGVLVPYSAVFHYVVEMKRLLGTHPEDRFSQFFDPSFDLSVHDMLVCWASGACLVPVPEYKLRYLDDMRALGVTVWFAVPSSVPLLERTGQLKPGSLPSLRLSLFCGEALLAQHVAAWRMAAPQSRILNLYGPTEATIAVSAHEVGPADPAEPIVPIGVPFGGNRLLLLDPETGEIQADGVGELAIAGPQLATGYWRDEALTRLRFPEIVDHAGQPTRIYRTGDRARTDAGIWHFLGRLDNEIKIHGYRINLLEIEAVLTELAEASLAVVLPSVQGELGSVELIGLVTGSEIDTTEILRRCRAALPSYMWPTAIRHVDTFARLPNGKIDRRTLAARYAA
jgi:D-alanine--poly(phosphoribitol) ligase subunit 1